MEKMIAEEAFQRAMNEKDKKIKELEALVIAKDEEYNDMLYQRNKLEEYIETLQRECKITRSHLQKKNTEESILSHCGEVICVREKVLFSEIKDGDFFFDTNKTLYKRILKGDLEHFEISCINAVSVANGGLTRFDDEEKVYSITKM